MILKKKNLVDKIKKSPINYFSDLFITSMVLMWIVDNVYQSIIASIVTISSVLLSIQTGMSSYDTSMWSSIGTNVAIPLSCGGAIWMIKNSIQHAISNYKGKEAKEDFPAANPDGMHEEIELETPMVAEDEDVEFEPETALEENPETIEPVLSEPIILKRRKRKNGYFGNLLVRLVDHIDSHRSGNGSG
jgi:hypothetical protein